jgi:hypothetical protein
MTIHGVGTFEIIGFVGMIERLGSRDLENGRTARGHAAQMDGQDFHCVDGPGFTQECFF